MLSPPPAIGDNILRERAKRRPHVFDDDDVRVSPTARSSSPRSTSIPSSVRTRTSPSRSDHYNESAWRASSSTAPRRFSVAFWHTIRNGSDDEEAAAISAGRPPDAQCDDPMRIAKRRMRALFELMRKLGVDRWCPRPRHRPRRRHPSETNGVSMRSPSTPSPSSAAPPFDRCGTRPTFLRAVSHVLGANHLTQSISAWSRAQVMSDGRHSLCNGVRRGSTSGDGTRGLRAWRGPPTSWPSARATRRVPLEWARAYWVSIGGTGPLLIEPKPQEPSKHQYDWDVATTAICSFASSASAILRVSTSSVTTRRWRVTRARTRWPRVATGAWGIDANTGDPQVFWDTDQFMTDHTHDMQVLLPARGCARSRSRRRQLRREAASRVHGRERSNAHAHVRARAQDRGGARETGLRSSGFDWKSTPSGPLPSGVASRRAR